MSTECFDRQYIRRVTAIQLDDCGRIPLPGDVAKPAIKGLADALQNITFTRNVDVPQQTVNKKVNGGNCAKPLPVATDRGVATAITFCGQNPVFESFAGYKTLDLVGDVITGYEEKEVTTNAKMALEIIYEPTSGSCSGAIVGCYAQIIPMLQQWVKSGDEVYNGADVGDLVLTGQQALSAHLFDNYTANTLPAWLSHWAARFDRVQSGESFNYTLIVPCPDADAGNNCALAAL